MVDITISPILSSYSSAAKINSNFQEVKDGLADTISKSEGGTMAADLDMNSNRIINLPEPFLANEAVSKDYVDSALGTLTDLTAISNIGSDGIIIKDNGILTTSPLTVVYPNMFGADTDLTGAQNQIGFDLLEERYPGYPVDLGGKLWDVTTLPVGANYYNGSFNLGGGTRHYTSASPKAHPFDTGSTPVIVPPAQAHVVPGPCGYHTPTGAVFKTYSIPFSHVSNLGSSLFMDVCYDGGNKAEQTRLMIELGPDEKLGGTSGGMVGNTFVVLAVVNDDAGYYQRMAVAYTTNGGNTIQQGSFTGPMFFPFGKLVIREVDGIPFMFGYGGGLFIAKGNATGTSWTSSDFYPGLPIPGGVNPVEFDVESLGNGRGYMALLRDDNATMSLTMFSDDMETWSNPLDCGFNILDTPPGLINYQGKLWIMATSRRSQVIDGFRNVLLFYPFDIDTVIADGGVFNRAPAPAKIELPSGAIGYLYGFKYPDNTYQGYLCVGESVLGSVEASDSLILRIGGRPTAVNSFAIGQKWVENSIIRNPGFDYWPRGTSFTGLTAGSNTKTAAGYFFSMGAGTTDITRVELDEATQKVFPHHPLYGQRVQAASGSGRFITQKIWGRENFASYLGRPITGSLALSGTAPGYFRFYVTLNYGSGGSSQKENFADAGIASLTDSAAVINATTSIPFSDSSATWGTAGTEYLEFKWLINDSAAVDFTVCGMWANLSDSYVPLAPQSYSQVVRDCERYVEVKNYVNGSNNVSLGIGLFGSSSSGVLDLHFPNKVRAPTLSFGSGYTFANINQALGSAATSASFDREGPSSARLILGNTVADWSTGVGYFFTSTAGLQLIVDAEIV